MKASVYDTYVPRIEGGIMHFDIIVPEDTSFDDVLRFGKMYLTSRNQDGQPLTTNDCKFCHVESATPEMLSSFETQGYYIVEMEGTKR